MSNSNDTPEYFAVVCPVCATRMYPPIEDEPSETKCPDCFTMVRVPALASLRASRPAAKVRPNAGTYEITATEEVRRPEPSANPELIRMVCPHCSAHLTPELKDKPQHVTCPDCLEVLDVPSREQARAKHLTKRRRKKRPRPEAETYAVPGVDDADVPPRPQAMSFETNPFDAQAEIRREAPPPIPRWTFFTGVFGFPWRAGVVSRWAYMMLGFVALGLVAALLMWAFKELPMAIPFFLIPVLFLTFMVLSYASACWSAILQDTAAGNDEIHGWLEPDWRDWFGKMIYLLFIGFIAGLAAWGVGLIAKASVGDWGFWLTFGGVLFFAYPVVLLSSLEANSPWVPLTRPVISSMATLWWGWMTYYALSAAVLAVYVVPLVVGIELWSPALTMLLTSPVVSAVVLIHARLLGRLAWRGIVRPSELDRDKRDRKKRKVSPRRSRVRPVA